MRQPATPHLERGGIVLVIGSLGAGGAERQLSDMANFWAARAWTVTLATWNGPEPADFYKLDRRVRRVHLGSERPGRGRVGVIVDTLRSVFGLRRLLVTTAPVAVLSFVTESNVLTILAALGLNVRIVVSERTQPERHVSLGRPWKLLRRALYPWSDAIVAQTRDAARWLDRNCRKAAAVIPNALRTLPQPLEARQPLVVAVGRLSREKGFDLLLRAFARIAPGLTDWSIVVVGEGIERARLLRLREELMLTERVQFIGTVRDVETWMARAGLVVQPSRYEGFPNVVLESMAMGAAVISADCASGPAELIDDGVNGRLVPVDDVDALARAMTELMSQPEVRSLLGRTASGVRRRFHQDLIMGQWETQLFPARPALPAEVRPK